MNKSSQEIATVDNTEAKFVRPENKVKKLDSTRRITYTATLIAASLALKILGNALQFGSFKITLVYIPWIISALVMGPLGAATVCLATDVIGTFILPTGGAPVPLIVLSNALFGLIMGLAFKLPRLNLRLKTLIGTVAVLICCTLGLSAYALSRLYSIPYLTELVLRLPQALMVAVNAAAAVFTFPLLKKLSLIA